ncbi:MAG: hypothetical protein EHM64_07285 [Ignavibacteriae bacterium]|nr:MAG: hypothetical protein EHM64_07285 [Ignavibacteriota bacterium]
MSNTTKNILSIVFTFVISRTVYWLTGFQPTRDYPFVVGTAIDIIIWLVLYFIIFWFVSKTLSAKFRNNYEQ